jgi:hypothetical protein
MGPIGSYFLKLASHCDSLGFHAEADFYDKFVYTSAEEDNDSDYTQTLKSVCVPVRLDDVANSSRMSLWILPDGEMFATMNNEQHASTAIKLVEKHSLGQEALDQALKTTYSFMSDLTGAVRVLIFNTSANVELHQKPTDEQIRNLLSINDLKSMTVEYYDQAGERYHASDHEVERLLRKIRSGEPLEEAPRVTNIRQFLNRFRGSSIRMAYYNSPYTPEAFLKAIKETAKSVDPEAVQTKDGSYWILPDGEVVFCAGHHKQHLSKIMDRLGQDDPEVHADYAKKCPYWFLADASGGTARLFVERGRANFVLSVEPSADQYQTIKKIVSSMPSMMEYHTDEGVENLRDSEILKELPKYLKKNKRRFEKPPEKSQVAKWALDPWDGGHDTGLREGNVIKELLAVRNAAQRADELGMHKVADELDRVMLRVAGILDASDEWSISDDLGRSVWVASFTYEYPEDDIEEHADPTGRLRTHLIPGRKYGPMPLIDAIKKFDLIPQTSGALQGYWGIEGYDQNHWESIPKKIDLPDGEASYLYYIALDDGNIASFASRDDLREFDKLWEDGRI